MPRRKSGSDKRKHFLEMLAARKAASKRGPGKDVPQPYARAAKGTDSPSPGQRKRRRS